MSDFDIVQKDGIYMDRKPLKIGDLTARIPVIQGGMGVGISLSHLAGSVAANGGVGILSAAQIGFREPDFEEHPKEANLRAHGNAEEELDADGNPFTAHTTNVVPLIVTNSHVGLKEGGKLGDLAPTMLQLLGLPIPEEMDGESLLK